MIRVELAPEPATFHEKVRQPGLSAIAELVGQPPLLPRPGPRRKPIAASRDEIPAEKFPPYWRDALDDLLAAYDRICAYICVYIEPVTGASSVDHMIPKSKRWQDVYEWANYRLACSPMNARKKEFADVLDPFEVRDGWFELELVGFQVMPSHSLDLETHGQVEATINRLKLNHKDCRELRESYAKNYWERHIDLAYLERRAPFVARELRRLGRLREEDT